VTYRPYPSATRARHQLARHVHYEDVPVITVRPETARLFREFTEALRSARPNLRQVMANAAALLPATRPDPGSSR
jgi:hypothetical protein